MKHLFITNFFKTKNSIFNRLVLYLPAITIIFWIVSSVFVSNNLKSNMQISFVNSNKRILENISHQSLNDLRFSDFYQLKRTLHNFFAPEYMDYFVAYTFDQRPFAIYPATQILGSDSELIENLLKKYATSEASQTFFKSNDQRRFHFQQQVIDESGKVLGYIAMGGRTLWLDSTARTQVFYFIVLGFIILLVELVVLIYFARKFTKPLEQLTNTLKIAQENSPEELIPTVLAQPELLTTCNEVKIFDSVMRKLLKTIQEYQQKEIALSIQATLGRLTAHFAHDIRTPISSINHYLKSHIPNDSADQEEVEKFNNIKKQVKKIDQMADELTSYTKAKEVRKLTVNINEILNEVRLDQIELIQAKNIKINIESPDIIKANLDIDKITRVLNNVVLNSIQAINHDHGEITITAKEQDVNLTIAVKDNGCGISPEHITRVFDSSFTHGKIKGTGLGLAYCKNVIEAHNGTIELESAINQGTTFTINIPNCITQKMTMASKPANLPTCQPASLSKQWLVVDDTTTFREQWREIIINQKLPPPIELKSPDEVNKCGLIFKDLQGAIVDYNYEGYNSTGLDIIQFLKHKGLNNVHLCTGNYNDEKIKKEANRLKVISIISKPIPNEVIDPIKGIFSLL